MRRRKFGQVLCAKTPAFFDANPELKEAYRKPVKNLPAEAVCAGQMAEWVSVDSFLLQPGAEKLQISKMSSRESLRKK
jgi:hypothetical protein